MFAPPQFLQLQKNRIRTMAFFASLKRKQSREGSLFFYFLNNLERWVPYPKLHGNFSSSIHSCFYTVFLNSNAGTQLPISLEFDFYMDRLFTHLLWIDFNGFFFLIFQSLMVFFFAYRKKENPVLWNRNIYFLFLFGVGVDRVVQPFESLQKLKTPHFVACNQSNTSTSW